LRETFADKSGPAGNPFEGPRSDEFPTPPLPPIYVAQLFEKATAELGYKSFPLPSANSSIAYSNPYGVRLGPCNLCGFCERFGCFLYSKASPQTTILPVLATRPNLEVRTNVYVTRILRDNTEKTATGVLYIDEEGREVEQPADIVVLSAFQMHNVRLLLLSGIGVPYDPASGEGVVGKNYAYQMCSLTAAYFGEDVEINPFIGAGAAGQRVVDEFNSDHFDHTGHGFIGGSLIYAGATGGRPIDQMMIPPDTPKWGQAWKTAVRKHYRHSAPIGTQGSVMSYRDRYLSLDPTYKDSHGLPLLRLTFDWHDKRIQDGRLQRRPHGRDRPGDEAGTAGDFADAAGRSVRRSHLSKHAHHRRCGYRFRSVQ
jgi:gluconate 2-dehydrogenase alpha chain